MNRMKSFTFNDFTLLIKQTGYYKDLNTKLLSNPNGSNHRRYLIFKGQDKLLV